MRSIAGTPSVVHDIMEAQEERELWIVAKEHERPPYFHAGKGMDTRLAKAIRVVQDGRIMPNSDGSFTIEGSEGRTYRCAETCSCPNSQKSSSKWCYHLISTALYVEWQRRLHPTPPLRRQVPDSPLAEERADADDLATRIDDEALGNGSPVDDETLPLPLAPVTIDERLAAVPAPTMPQEALMPADESIPEPEDTHAPVAVLEPPVPEPVRVTIPAEYVMSIQGKRHILYAGLVIGAQRSGLVTLSADWTYNDAELSLAHAVATFSDGRRYEDSGDASPGNVNKGIAKHFRRVALTRAKARCLRDALGIQECSVEELAAPEEPQAIPDLTRPRSEQELRHGIWAQVHKIDGTIRTRAQVEAFITERTGMALHPDFYEAIYQRLHE